MDPNGCASKAQFNSTNQTQISAAVTAETAAATTGAGQALALSAHQTSGQTAPLAWLNGSSYQMSSMFAPFDMTNLNYQNGREISLSNLTSAEQQQQNSANATLLFYNDMNLSSNSSGLFNADTDALLNNFNNQLDPGDSRNIFSSNSSFVSEQNRINLEQNRRQQLEQCDRGRTYSSVLQPDVSDSDSVTAAAAVESRIFKLSQSGDRLASLALQQQEQASSFRGKISFPTSQINQQQSSPSSSANSGKSQAQQHLQQQQQQQAGRPSNRSDFLARNSRQHVLTFQQPLGPFQTLANHHQHDHHQFVSKIGFAAGQYNRSVTTAASRASSSCTRSSTASGSGTGNGISTTSTTTIANKRSRNKLPFFGGRNFLGEGQPGYKLDATGTGVVSTGESERFSRKVFVGGLPPDIDEEEIKASFRRFGSLIVDWPHKAESKSYFPPKGYAFLLFQEESFVQSLIDSCFQDEDKLYLCVSSPTIKDKPVQIRPWRLSDSDFVLDLTLALDPRKTVFVGGVPRPLKASELAKIMNNLYGGVCYAGIDTDPELKYPKGAGRVAFSNHRSYIDAISARFVHIHHSEIEKRVEVKPYVLDDQHCDECQGARCNNKFAPFFCANIVCLQYYCDNCWTTVHSQRGKELHKPLVKEGGDRPRGGQTANRW